MNIYRYSDYRQIIKKLVEQTKKTDSSVNYSTLASALRVQKTHISKILKGSAHLSSDQLYLLIDFFKLTLEEGNYLSLLIEKERTGIAPRRQQLEAKIGAIQSQHRDTRKTLKAKMIESEESKAYAEYYLDPLMTIVDVFLMVPQYQKNPQSISKILGIGEGHLKRILSTMEKLKMIKRDEKEKSYYPLQNDTILTKDSPLCSPHQVLLRLLSAFHALRIPADERFNFSMTIATDARTRAYIHDKFLEFLRAIESEIKSSQPEEIYQINFELFPWRII
jgi:uncharacterized protein (TIGR02147 family)